ncbi:hypothetical protein CHLRE_02g095084v5 [Chlamydomonas reinhardtii]|uniref:Uncharacterized protein n=1 Tax=Chlamydomonas reinhardtii TaxID=3055 RepID=A0A2K3E1N3_CHLRE|nr:uncharacterized protein CHLRE_02g095084v5 [Chlamydomonas reinhardtii]PNW86698.1 hypothetical protein CHLRE_02g095084v5 [Chlamydomonas reinhardtii]
MRKSRKNNGPKGAGLRIARIGRRDGNRSRATNTRSRAGIAPFPPVRERAGHKALPAPQGTAPTHSCRSCSRRGRSPRVVPAPSANAKRARGSLKARIMPQTPATSRCPFGLYCGGCC